MFKPKNSETERWVNCQLRINNLPELSTVDMKFVIKHETRHAGNLAFESVSFYKNDKFLFWSNLASFEHNFKKI